MLTGPPTICANLPSAGPPAALPHLLPSMSSIRLLLIRIRIEGWLGEASSGPATLKPPPELRGHVFANFVQSRFPTFGAHRLTALHARPGVEQRLLDLEQKTFAISTNAAAPDRFHFRDRGRNHL